MKLRILALLLLLTACSKPLEVHETQEARSSRCVDCHSGAFVAATKPKHDGIFPQGCADCHSQKAWVPVPNFHDLAAVEAKGCVDCHRQVYDKTTNPKHEPNFPTDCKDCHATMSWAPIAKDIHTTQTFTKTECYACHKTQYEATTTPKHVGVFPTTCKTCHTPGAWKPAVASQ